RHVVDAAALEHFHEDAQRVVAQLHRRAPADEDAVAGDGQHHQQTLDRARQRLAAAVAAEIGDELLRGFDELPLPRQPVVVTPVPRATLDAADGEELFEFHDTMWSSGSRSTTLPNISTVLSSPHDSCVQRNTIHVTPNRVCCISSVSLGSGMVGILMLSF